MLRGLRIAELAITPMAAYAGYVLRLLGAEVSRIEPKAGAPDPWPQLSGCRKRLAASEVESRFDAVVTDGAPVSPTKLAPIVLRLTYARPDGPYANLPLSGEHVAALAGAMWAIGEPGRSPLSLPPRTVECMTGASGVSALLAALIGRRSGSQVSEVSVAATRVLAGWVEQNSLSYRHTGIGWRRAGRRAAGSAGIYPYGIFACRDGQVALIGRSRRDWLDMLEALGKPAWAQPYQDAFVIAAQQADQVDFHLGRELAEYSRDDLMRLAETHRVLVAPVLSPAEVRALPALRGRGFFTEVAEHELPGLPFVFKRQPSAGPSRPRRGAVAPLAGFRAIDLGWVWSGPMVGAMLADLGAEVIKVESEARLDNYRLRGVERADVAPEVRREMSPSFHQLNRGKQSVTLNLKAPDGLSLLRDLLSESDLMIENYSGGTLERMGLDDHVLDRAAPGLVALSLSAAGQSGPWRSLRSYALIASALAGWEGQIGYPGEAALGSPTLGIADPVAATYGLLGMLAAVWSREEDGHGTHVDLSQIESLAAVLVQSFIAPDVRPDTPSPVAVPRGGDAWELPVPGGEAVPVHSIESRATDPEFCDDYLAVDHPITGRESLLPSPWRFDRFEQSLAAAPLLGQDTERVLTTVGQLDARDIERLRAAEVLA